MTVLEGRVLAGRYRLEERIGAGGMGQVWRALDTVLDRPVAVKLLAHAGTEDPTTTERFAREARATAALNHPNVVTVHDSGIEDDLAFIVMELLPGPSLADELARGPLAVDLVEQVARDVLAGLGAAHALGLVHRDIKPGNVVRAADGGWRVVDFGISRLGDTSDGGPDGPLTATHVVIGTADYLAPEQALGRPVDGRADLYALGCVLWTLLAGHVPLSGATPVATMLRHAHETVPRISTERPETPKELADLVGRLTATDPSHRPATAEAALALLDGAPAASVTDGATTTALPTVGGTEALSTAGEAAAAMPTASATEVLPAAGATQRLPVTPPPPPLPHAPMPTAGPVRPPSEHSAPEADRRWGRWLAAVLVVLVAALLLKVMLGAEGQEAASPPPGTASASSPAQSPSQPPAEPTTSTPVPSTGPGAAAVAAAVDAVGQGVAQAERLKALDKAAAKGLDGALREVSKAVRAAQPVDAVSAVGTLRTTWNDAVAAGQVEPAAQALLGPLLDRLDEVVTAWAG